MKAHLLYQLLESWVTVKRIKTITFNKKTNHRTVVFFVKPDPRMRRLHLCYLNVRIVAPSAMD